MSLIHSVRELRKAVDAMEKDAKRQQEVSYVLIGNIVRLRQQYRLDKNFEVADALRGILDNIGVVVTNGTAGYEYDRIPPALKGRPVDDTWEWKK